MGEHRIRHRLRVLDASMRAHETLRDVGRLGDRRRHVHRRRDPARAEDQTAEGEGEAGGRTGGQEESAGTGGDGRREGRRR